MQRVRETILGADERMTERVQYGTITFACKDNMASFVQVANNRTSRAPGPTPVSCASPISKRPAREQRSCEISPSAGAA